MEKSNNWDKTLLSQKGLDWGNADIKAKKLQDLQISHHIKDSREFN